MSLLDNNMISPVPGSFGSLGAITNTTGGAYPAGGQSPYANPPSPPVPEPPLDSGPIYGFNPLTGATS